MVITQRDKRVDPADLRLLQPALRLYIGLTAATLLALVALSASAPHLATDHAWGHTVVVAVFAVVLPLRARGAAEGERRAMRNVCLIGVALFVVNITEAQIPGFLPTWMRIEMFGVAALMAGMIAVVVTAFVRAGLRRNR